MVRLARSSAVSVTRRNRSDRRPTRPATHTPGPFARTVSTSIGSLNCGPLRICPSWMTKGALNGEYRPPAYGVANNGRRDARVYGPGPKVNRKPHRVNRLTTRPPVVSRRPSTNTLTQSSSRRLHYYGTHRPAGSEILAGLRKETCRERMLAVAWVLPCHQGDRFRPAIDRHCDVGADHQATGW